MDTTAALVLTVMVLSTIQVCTVNGDEDEYRLLHDLMKNYDPRIRPSLNSSDSLNCTFGLALAQIIDVDEKNQIFTTNCWLNQAWLDHKLSWNPTQYGGIKVIRIPYDTVWRPDILLYNNADVSSFMSAVSTNVIVDFNGNVTWLSTVIFKSSCTINVGYFPFDEQNCSMKFASWTYDGYKVNLDRVGDAGDLSNYIPSTEWALINLYVERNVVYYSCCKEPYPDVTYYIHIRRRPLFYVFNMILPCILITFVALLGFYMPPDSGEKVTMGITTLLSMTVFLMLVAEAMPPTSDTLPLIGIYYGITIAIVSFATAMTVLTLNIHHKGIRGKEVPSIIKKICFGFLARVLCIHLELPDAIPPGANAKVDSEDGRAAYFRLKGSIKRLGSGDNHSVPGKKTVFEFVPQKEDIEKLPENGGVSPRFGGRLPHITSNISSSNSSDIFEKQFLRVLSKVNQTIEKNEVRLAEQDRRDCIKLEWQQVALVVDRVLLYLFIIATVAVTLAIMLQAPHTGDPSIDPTDSPSIDPTANDPAKR